MLKYIGVALATTFALGLVLTIHYAYLEPRSHYLSDTCSVFNCTIHPDTCCGRSRLCSACYHVAFNYYLWDNNYTKIGNTVVYNQSYCNTANITCYYDDQNIYESLRLSQPYEAVDGIVGICILSVALAFTLLATIILFIRDIMASKPHEI